MDTSFSSALLSRADHATAAIDWCERNYVVSPSIAEYYNTFSSLLMCVSGIAITMRVRRVRTQVLPLSAAGPIIFALGVASAVYHATLSLPWQRADEVAENVSVTALLHSALRAGAGRASARRADLSFTLHALIAFTGVVCVSSFLFAELHLVGVSIAATRASNAAAPTVANAAFRTHLRVAVIAICAAALRGSSTVSRALQSSQCPFICNCTRGGTSRAPSRSMKDSRQQSSHSTEWSRRDEFHQRLSTLFDLRPFRTRACDTAWCMPDPLPQGRAQTASGRPRVRRPLRLRSSHRQVSCHGLAHHRDRSRMTFSHGVVHLLKGALISSDIRLRAMPVTVPVSSREHVADGLLAVTACRHGECFK